MPNTSPDAAPDGHDGFSPDAAQTDPKNDRLGYAPFARQVARSLLRMAPSAGMVAAVYAPWGAGKTTLLNFIEHYLTVEQKDTAPIIVHFNPWWFSGDEDLVRHFFGQLQAALKTNAEKVGEDVLKKIGGFAEAVSELPLTKLLGFFGKVTNLPLNVEEITKIVAKFLKEEERDVVALKSQATEALRKQAQKILVIIDDIDRLTPEEARQLFRVIKAVADFPNVIYLLAFDRSVAAESLRQIQGGSGEAYLEKIVQVSFDLPMPDRTSLRKLLFEKLNAVLDASQAQIDNGYWSNVYFDGIDPFIQRPRDIIRLTNALHLTFPAVAGEVNPVDFIALEALHTFCPAAYSMIRANEKMFTGNGEGSEHTQKAWKQFHIDWLEQVGPTQRESVKRLLVRLFPKMKVIWSNISYGRDWEGTWRRDLRVCSESVFPVYFRMTVPEESVSNAELRSLLAVAEDAEAFAAALRNFNTQKRSDGQLRVRAVMERLEDYTDKDIPAPAIPSVIQALLEVGDEVVVAEPPRSGFMDFGVDVHIGRVIWQLLQRMEEEARFTVLIRAFNNPASSVGTMVREVSVLGQQQGKHDGSGNTPEDEWIVSGTHLAELEAQVVQRIQAAAQGGTLLTVPYLTHVLHLWRELGPEADARNWMQQTVQTDEGLLAVLEKALSRTRSQSSDDVTVKVSPRLNPKWLSPFLEPSEIVPRLETLSAEAVLTEGQRTAVEQYLKEYRVLQDGKDPDSLW